MRVPPPLVQPYLDLTMRCVIASMQDMKQKTLTIQEYELPVTVHEEDGGFVAVCPAWQDCYAQADTIEDVITEISSVAASLIELYKEENMPIPLRLKSTTEKAPSGFTLNFPLIVSSE